MTSTSSDAVSAEDLLALVQTIPALREDQAQQIRDLAPTMSAAERTQLFDRLKRYQKDKSAAMQAELELVKEAEAFAERDQTKELRSEQKAAEAAEQAETMKAAETMINQI